MKWGHREYQKAYRRVWPEKAEMRRQHLYRAFKSGQDPDGMLRSEMSDVKELREA
jgi:hypothetical protein